MLKGKKTYAAAAGLFLVALGSFLHGDASLLEAVTIALNGLGLAGLRNAL